MDLLATIKCDHRVGNPVVAFVLVTCPRCNGKGYYHDISYDTKGKVNTIQGGYQLQQQITKLLTEKMRKTGYAFDFSTITNTVSSSTLLVIKREISRCLNYYVNNQNLAVQQGYHFMTTEKVASVDIVSVVQNPEEPRSINALINIYSESGQPVQVQVTLRR